MIKELVNFSKLLSEDFKALGKTPKEGLHILLKVNDDNGSILTVANSIEYAYYNKKMVEISPFLIKSIQLQENAWMLDTNKCLDTITRAIHTSSPFSIAIKKDNLKGGKNYINRMTEGKKLVYNSFENYFEKARCFLDESEFLESVFNSFSEFIMSGSWEIVLEVIEAQRSAKYNILKNKEEQLKEQLKAVKDKAEKTRINEEIEVITQEKTANQNLSDSEYVIFYLDLPLSVYKSVHTVYLDDKLFNTAEYNSEPDENGIIYGTSNFMNTFNTKMPFLIHQSATFDISTRISNHDAKALYELEKVFPNKTLPNPLPIFIYQNESFDNMIFALYKEGKRGFREIIESLYHSFKNDFQNYYLLNWSNTTKGIVFNDFDYVAKFEYDLNELELQNYFHLSSKEKGGLKHYFPLRNIFDLEDQVLKYLIQNKYHRVNYFSDFKTEEYERMPMTFLSFSKYRKTIYDYVYKSNRNAIGGREFDELIFNSIQDDIKRGNEYGIKEKLNYWYSLYDFFHLNNLNMASKLKEYQDFISSLIDGNAKLENAKDEHFAFAAGQVIYYLLSKSKSSDTSFRLMEPYLQKTKCTALQENIAEDFARYKHENFSSNFEKAASFVLSYETDQNIKKLQPQLLSGLFAKNQLFSNKTQKHNEENTLIEKEKN